MAQYYFGHLEAAIISTKRALDGYAGIKTGANVLRFQFDQRTLCGTNLAKMLWLRGYPEQALRMADLSIDYGKEVEHGSSVTYAIAYAACTVAILTGDLQRAERYLEMLFEQTLQDPSGQWVLLGRCWQGVLLSRRGDAVAAVDLLQTSLQHVPENSFRMHYTRFLGELAFALGCAGRVTSARTAIDRAVAICEANDGRWAFPELLRLQGEITLMEAGPDAVTAAESQYRSSIDWARKQGALSWELRAATSLARLCARSTGSAAIASLQAVYARFTEGFETDDLKEARSLLNDLRSS